MLRGTYIELQYSRRSILELVRTSLVLNYPPFNPILPPTGRQLPVADDGTTYVVNQTAFLTEPGATSVRHGAPTTWFFEWGDVFGHSDPVPARACEVTQRLRLIVARRTSPPNAPPQSVDVGTIEGTLVVLLNAVVDENVPALTVNAAHFTVETDGVDAALVALLERNVAGSFLNARMPLSLRRLLGQPTPTGPTGYDPNASAPHVQNCGVAYAADLSTFALRIQLGGGAGSGLVNEWTAFHAGSFPNRLQLPGGTSQQWGVLLSPPLVESLTVQQTEEQLAAHEDDFRLAGGVGATWSPEGSDAHVHGEFRGTVLVPCRPDYRVTFDARLQVTTPNQLVSVTSVDRHGDFWDLLACEGLVALGAGVTGAITGTEVGGPLGSCVGFAIGLGVGFFGAMIGATVYTPDMGTANCTQDGDVVTCTRAMNPALQFAGATLAIQIVSATATDDGLLLGGTYALPLIPALRQTILEIEVEPFDYAELPVNCGNLSLALLLATSDAEATAFTTAEATITLRAVDDDGQPNKIAWVTVARTSPDPTNAFPPSAFQIVPYPDRTVIVVHPRVGDMQNPDYWKAAYGVTLAIGTPTGVRTVTLGAAQRLTPARLAALRDRALRKLNDCLAKQSGVITSKQRVEWLVDPTDTRVVRLWEVAVLGVRPNEAVQLEDRDGRVIGATRADGRGTARLSARTDDGAAHDELVLHRMGAPVRSGRRWDVRLKQVELLPQGTLAPGGTLRRVVTRETGGRALAVVHTTEAIVLYDLTFPAMPRTLLRLDADAVDGAEALDDGLATWGPDGLTAWSLDAAPRRLADTAVTSVRRDRGALLVATGSRVLRLARDGVRVVRAPLGTDRGCDGAVDRLLGTAAEAVDAAESAIASLLAPHSPTTVSPTNTREFHTVGATLLVPSDDGRVLQHYVAGRWIDR